jgi:hypothetical protein
MTFSALLPSWKGWVVLGIGFGDAAIVPLLVPAYDGPPVTPLQLCIAILLAAMTAFGCIRVFRKGRTADKVAVFLTGAFALWLFGGYALRVPHI